MNNRVFRKAMAVLAVFVLVFGAFAVHAGDVFAHGATDVSQPTASGINVSSNARSEIDYSNVSDGYFMARWLDPTATDVRITVYGPNDLQYQYRLNTDGRWEVFPLSEGNGRYRIRILVNIEGTRFSSVNNVNVDVVLTDEFAPFVRPNQYVNYNKDSQAVKKAGELVKDSKTTLDKVSAVYNYVIKNLTYDKEKAKTVKAGYLPDVDAVLKAGKGICFDYAAVMAAMLRSQNIPTKLVVGYTGEVYHAWLNVYSTESGWVNSVIQFDGKKWKLMDPTFASSGNQSKEVMQHIGDGKNYTAKYLY